MVRKKENGNFYECDLLHVRYVRRWESNWLKHRRDRGKSTRPKKYIFFFWPGREQQRRRSGGRERCFTQLLGAVCNSPGEHVVGKEEEGVTYSFSQEGMRRKEKEEETVPAHQVYFFSLSHSACVPESIAPQYSHTPPRKNNFFVKWNFYKKSRRETQ